MKRILVLVLLLALVVGTAYGDGTTTCSGLVTSTQQVYTGACKLWGLFITTTGAGHCDATCTVYDSVGTTNVADGVLYGSVNSGAGTNTRLMMLTKPVDCANGIYLSITTAGGTGYSIQGVYYDPM